jgi:hypothetical protein
MRKRRRRQSFRRSGRACRRALVASCLAALVLGDGLQSTEAAATAHRARHQGPRCAARASHRRLVGGSGLACLARKERAHMSAPIFYVRTTMHRETLWLVGWIREGGEAGDGLRVQNR